MERNQKSLDPQINWSVILYNNHPILYLPILESMKGQATIDTHGLYTLFKEFDVSLDSKILDFSCGIGRHSVSLIKNGYTNIVGYDPSSFFLEEAKLYAAKETGNFSSKLRFYHGDPYSISEVLSTNNEKEFNAIIIMFNSFGFAREIDDIKILQELSKIAANNCILIIETENRDWRIRNMQPYNYYDFDKTEIHESWSFDLETSVANGKTRFYEKIPDKKDLRFLLELTVKLRLYSLHELIKLLNRGGWKYMKSFGSIQTLIEASYETQNLVTISKKMAKQ
jgi:SAM-dependent methyltransferase